MTRDYAKAAEQAEKSLNPLFRGARPIFSAAESNPHEWIVLVEHLRRPQEQRWTALSNWFQSDTLVWREHAQRWMNPTVPLATKRELEDWQCEEEIPMNHGSVTGSARGALAAAVSDATTQPVLYARLEAAERHLQGITEARIRLENALNRMRTAPPKASGNDTGAMNHPQPVSLERRLELLDLEIKGEANELHQLANAFDQVV